MSRTTKTALALSSLFVLVFVLFSAITLYWFQGPPYPAGEASVPVSQVRMDSLALLASGIALAILLTWLIMKRHLSPPAALSPATGENESLSTTNDSDELALMGKSFNTTLGSLKEGARLSDTAADHFAAMNAFNRDIIDSSLDMIIAVAKDRKIMVFNKAAEETFGYSKSEVVGRHISVLYQDPVHGAEINRQIREKGSFMGEIVNRRKNGDFFPSYLSASCLRDNEGTLIGVMGISRDITESKRAEEALRQAHDRLKQQVNIDALTGAFNRFKFDETLEAEIARAKRYNTLLSLIMIDIDYFKRINDTLGHLTGDTVLREFVGLVSDNIRKNDVFARWGGEEFMILAPNTELENAEFLAEKLRGLISSARFESDASVTASFGVAMLRPEDTFDTFTMRTDAALYRAKENGRNRVELEQ